MAAFPPLALDLTDLNLNGGEEDLIKWSRKYGHFICHSRDTVKEEDICLFEHKFHVLPKDLYIELISVVLKIEREGDQHEITVFLRRINLYVVGFQNQQGDVFKFKNVNDVLNDAVPMDIKDQYADMSKKLGVSSSREQLQYGPRPLFHAIMNLSHTQGWNGIVNVERAKSLLTIILMIPEALRFPICSYAMERLNDYQIRLDPDVFDIQTKWRNRSDRIHNIHLEIKNARKRRIIKDDVEKRWSKSVDKLRNEVRVVLNNVHVTVNA